MGPECCFLIVIRVDPNLVVPRSQIQFWKDSGARDLIEQLLHRGNWEPVFHSGGILDTAK